MSASFRGGLETHLPPDPDLLDSTADRPRLHRVHQYRSLAKVKPDEVAGRLRGAPSPARILADSG